MATRLLSEPIGRELSAERRARSDLSAEEFLLTREGPVAAVYSGFLLSTGPLALPQPGESIGRPRPQGMERVVAQPEHSSHGRRPSAERNTAAASTAARDRLAV